VAHKEHAGVRKLGADGRRGINAGAGHLSMGGEHVVALDADGREGREAVVCLVESMSLSVGTSHIVRSFELTLS
jgi:hypothetical protein